MVDRGGFTGRGAVGTEFPTSPIGEPPIEEPEAAMLPRERMRLRRMKTIGGPPPPTGMGRPGGVMPPPGRGFGMGLPGGNMLPPPGGMDVGMPGGNVPDPNIFGRMRGAGGNMAYGGVSTNPVIPRRIGAFGKGTY